MRRTNMAVGVVGGLLWLLGATALAQAPTATGTINATLINKNGISLIFNSNAAGVSLGGNGSSSASLNFGTISAFGPLAAGVTRTAQGPSSFTVRTVFDVKVIQAGLTSTSYRLSVNLAAAAATGFVYLVDAVPLTTTAQAVQTNGTYNANVSHNLDLTIATAAPGAGGPAVGTPISATINFTAVAN